MNADSQANVTAAMAQKRLRDTKLVSPLTGTIGRRLTNPGETVPAGAPVFTIVDLDVVHVRVAVPESDIGSITTGAAATVTVPSLGDTTFSGRVRLVGVSADPVTRTFAVEIAVPNPGARIKQGMIAEASIDTPNNTTTLTLPAAAIVRDAEGAKQVFVYSSDERRVHARRVTLGTVTGSEVEIENGLAAGDVVVVGGQHRLREGMTVHPTSTVSGTARGSQR
jgi:RND family efflux transporter MFP subunit